jgi:hypothetical protein
MFVVVVVVMDMIMVVTMFDILLVVRMTMGVAMAAVPVGVIMEENQAYHIGEKAQASDDADQLRILHLLRLNQSLDSLQEDRHTQCNQENTIHKGTESFRALPLAVQNINY